MNNDSFQDSLFDDPIALRFRHCREKQRMSLESVAQQLKLPVAILEAIEREDWARLGAPIFVRSYVGSYAKFLGLPATLADEVVHVEGGRVVDRGTHDELLARDTGYRELATAYEQETARRAAEADDELALDERIEAFAQDPA